MSDRFKLRSVSWATLWSVLVGSAVLLFVWGVFKHGTAVIAAGGPAEINDAYRVLAPIESGNLLLFPVVRANSKSATGTPFLTLDEGLKSGSVEVTEAGRVRGLVRRRDGGGGVWGEHIGGDQVNTLVLVNNSNQPLLLLAGEIVTGGKQDRVIAKDRIVPAGGDPIDLSVFCIEPGRWTESSPVFGASAKGTVSSFMVQPQVRQQAMVAKDQQQVWNSVHGAIAAMAAAPAPSSSPGVSASPDLVNRPLQTTSYAKAMQSEELKAKVDDAAAPLMKSREEVIAQLRKEGAVGVVVAVRGEVVWADIFANTELLSRYWTKLVRSYAAESLNPGETHAAPTVADAQHFIEAPTGGTETSEGSVGIYRYRELKAGVTETFVLESLIPEARYDVHISKLKLRNTERRFHPMPMHVPNGDPLPPPQLRLIPERPMPQ
jgi:hypothetical protein